MTATAAIPTQTLNRIVGVFDQNPILSRITMTYIPGNITIPVEGTVNSASWVAVGTASTDSADTITSVSLGAYMLIKTVEITADVQTMSIDAFETWLVGRLANKLEAALDAAVFTGTGSSQATGILKTLDTATGTFTKAKATYADLIKIIKKNISPKQQNALPNGLICLKGGELEHETMPFKHKTVIHSLSKNFEEEFFETKKVVYSQI